MKNELKNILKHIKKLDVDKQIEYINEIKVLLHEISPFNGQPVDCVLWVKNDNVFANDYNPNSVAPPEMELLRLSIANDGYTQPIVSMQTDNNKREVIDGFHRNRVGKECKDIQSKVLGYLPVVTIRETQENKGDRIASTIRHNRARGKHRIDAMSEIVLDLKKRNWSDKKIAKQLGMDQDEVLRLKQLTGLAELFKNIDFTEAWEAEILDKEIEIINEENISQEK